MATKPTTGHLDWITDDDAAKFAAPSGAKQLQGWQADEKPPFQYFNWAFRLVDRWLKYLDQQVDEHAALTDTHSATSAPAADRIVMRDSNGRAQVAAPLVAEDIARLDTVQNYFPSGTVMVFGQNSAPTGWTRKTDWQDNAVLCYSAAGIIGSGGSLDPQAGHVHATQGHQLTVDEMPSHPHPIDIDPNGFLAQGGTSNVATPSVGGMSSNSVGGNQPHDHGNTAASGVPYYQDVIAATKD